MVLCSSIAPLDTPVVPPVYCSTATSSALISGATSFIDRPAASAALKVVCPGSDQAGTILRRTMKSTIGPLGKPSRSPIAATTTCLMSVWAIACCKVAAKFSSTRMACAPESLS